MTGCQTYPKGSEGEYKAAKAYIKKHSERTIENELPRYARDKKNKALAISLDGAIGVGFNNPSVGKAKALALKECNNKRKGRHRKCRIIMVNDRFVGR